MNIYKPVNIDQLMLTTNVLYYYGNVTYDKSLFEKLKLEKRVRSITQSI